MTELKPCPFCGGEVELGKASAGKLTFYHVSCKCMEGFAPMVSRNPEKVKKQWNTRAGDKDE